MFSYNQSVGRFRRKCRNLIHRRYSPSTAPRFYFGRISIQYLPVCGAVGLLNETTRVIELVMYMYVCTSTALMPWSRGRGNRTLGKVRYITTVPPGEAGGGEATIQKRKREDESEKGGQKNARGERGSHTGREEQDGDSEPHHLAEADEDEGQKGLKCEWVGGGA